MIIPPKYEKQIKHVKLQKQNKKGTNITSASCIFNRYDTANDSQCIRHSFIFPRQNLLHDELSDEETISW